MVTKGICLLSAIPMRSETSDKAEIITQLLFGELFEIIEVSSDNKWLKILIESDGYIGWIDEKQGQIISTEQYHKLKNQKKYKTEEAISIIRNKDMEFLIPAGSSFYFAEPEKMILEEEYLIHGKLADIEKQRGVDAILALALSYYNVPYLWGGKTHFGIDCSGLVQVVFGICGYAMPRDAWQQALKGSPVNWMDIAAGDLAFFSNEKGKVIHVGIVMNNQEIIHASGKVRIDRLENKGIYKKEINDFSHFLTSIKRIVV